MTLLVKTKTYKTYNSSKPSISIFKNSKFDANFKILNGEQSCDHFSHLVSVPIFQNPQLKQNIFIPCQTSMWKDFFCKRRRMIKHFRFSVPDRSIAKFPTTEYTLKKDQMRSILKRPEWICPMSHKWVSLGHKCMTLYKFDYELKSPDLTHFAIASSTHMQPLTQFFEQNMCLFRNNVQRLNITRIANLRDIILTLRPHRSGVFGTGHLFIHQPEILKLLSIVLSHISTEVVTLPMKKYDLQFIPRYNCIILASQIHRPGFGSLLQTFLEQCGIQPQFVYFSETTSLFSLKQSNLYFCETNIERNLEKPRCKSQFYECSDGTCVSYYERCNSVAICSDGSDELECRSLSKEKGIAKCPQSHFHCTSGECIHIDKVCDMMLHCSDKSDEYLCDDSTYKYLLKITMKHEKIAKGLEPGSGINFHLPAVNRGQINHIINVLKYSSGSNIAFDFRGESLLTCSLLLQTFHISTTCFMKEFNGELLYCVDGSHLAECNGVNCQNNFKCKISGICIALEYLCNGYRDCEFGEDEENCKDLSCPGMLKCGGSGVCIEHQEICNGVISCHPYGDDELFCFDCPQNCTCEGLHAECYLEIDSSNNAYLNIEQGNFKSVKALIYPKSKNNVTFNLNTLKRVLKVSMEDNSLSSINYSDDKSYRNTPYQNVSHIKVLLLNHNLLRNLCCEIFRHMYFLTQLSANENMITHVSDDVFAGAVNIRIIELSRNHICCVTKYAFRGNIHLKSLDLSNNPLVSLHWDTFQFLTSLEMFGTDSNYLCCALGHVKSCNEENKKSLQCNLSQIPIFYNVLLLVFGILCILVNSVAYLKIEAAKTLENISKVFLIIMDALFGVYLIVISYAFYQYRNSFTDNFKKWQSETLCLLCSFIFWTVTELTTLVTCVIAIGRAVAAVRPFSKNQHFKRYALCIKMASVLVLALLGYLFIDHFSDEFSGTGDIFHPDVFCNSYILLHVDKTFQIIIFITVAVNICTVIGFTVSYIIVYFIALKGYFRFSVKGKNNSKTIFLFVMKGIRLLLHNGIFTGFKLVMYLGVLTKSQDTFTLLTWYTMLIHPCYSLLNHCMYCMGGINFARIKNKHIC